MTTQLVTAVTRSKREKRRGEVMKKITEFNKVNLELVRAEVQKVVDTLVKGTGMTIKTCAGGKYASTTFKFPIEVDLNIGEAECKVGR